MSISLLRAFHETDTDTEERAVNDRLNQEKEAQSLLCRRCQRIEFAAERFHHQNNYWLGSFNAVLSRTNCPLCRLVIAAITQFRDGIDDEHPGRPYGIGPSEDVELSGWENPPGYSINLALDGTRLCLVKDEDVDENAGSRARLISSGHIFDATNSYIDQAHVDDWIDNCKELHGDICAPLKGVKEAFAASVFNRLGSSFRLIDVQSYCIVEAPETCQYVPLSYIWGGVPTIRLLQDNKEELMKAGSLKRYWGWIPRTIKDAIALTQIIYGTRFLWVDALCLVQDDAIDMLLVINKMDVIYEGAMITIVAAAGNDANAGLPGVRYGSRKPTQAIERIKPGIRMAVVNNVEDILQLSKYSERGWT